MYWITNRYPRNLRAAFRPNTFVLFQRKQVLIESNGWCDAAGFNRLMALKR